MRIPRKVLQYPHSFERDAVQNINLLMGEWKKYILIRTIPDLEKIIEPVAISLNGVGDDFKTIGSILNSMALKFSNYLETKKIDTNKPKQTEEQIKAQSIALMFGEGQKIPDRGYDLYLFNLGKSLAKKNKAQLQIALDFAGISLLQIEPWINDFIFKATKEHVELIKSIPQEFSEDVRKLVTDYVSSGKRAAGLADEIMMRFGVSEARANLISRDQVSKLYSSVNKQRQIENGITKYRWSTARDSRVRDSHRKVEGKLFAWDSPPEIRGVPRHPGEDFQCRCIAQPVFGGE